MKEHWYYPHEEYFFWLMVIVLFLVAWSAGGINFIATLLAGLPFWAAVYLIWYAFARVR